MAKRRRIRQRDSEATKRKLLDAVSAIMREHGFAGLRTVAISRFVGQDKNLIRYHFSGLAGLQKAYIREKDYWPPFFERFAISSDSSAFEIEQLFSELMQENLRFFYSDVEMQKIILWQISEKNALMRSISDAREADGAKLLDLTDRFFLGTDVNFRAVIALLLGGVYYMVLHANGNGSVVCGIDVHSDRDRADVLRTIGQVVSWSFRQVDDGLVFSGGGSVSGDRFSVLDNLASRFGLFVSSGRTDFLYLESLELELERLRLSIEGRLLEIADPVLLSSFVRVCIFRIVGIVDRFYLDQEKEHRESVLVCSLLEVFLAGFRDLVPSELVLPKVLWDRELFSLSQTAGEIEKMLAAVAFHELLGKAALEPFSRFYEGKGGFTFGELASLKRYLEMVCCELQRMSVTEEELFLAQIGMGEYGGGLLDYLKAVVEAASLGKSGLALRGLLIEKRNKIASVEVSSDGTTKKVLLRWLDGELAGLDMNPLSAVNQLKFTSGLKVVELAYLLKLLYDQGVFGPVRLDTFVGQVGHNFMSSSGVEISAGSVKSKLYPKDEEVIGGVESLLVSMLEQLRSCRS